MVMKATGGILIAIGILASMNALISGPRAFHWGAIAVFAQVLLGVVAIALGARLLRLRSRS
jgi:hypothetical protein